MTECDQCGKHRFKQWFTVNGTNSLLCKECAEFGGYNWNYKLEESK